jgi:phage shock protein C
MDDRLYRSVDDRMLAGVAGGVAERLDADPSIIRVVWALLVVLTGGVALVAYVVMAFVVPEAPDDRPVGPSSVEPGRAGLASAEPAGGPDPDAPTSATASSWLAADERTAAVVSATAAVTTEAAESVQAASPIPAPGTPGSWVAPDGRTVARADGPATNRPRATGRDEGRGGLVGGLLLISIGGFFLLRQLLPDLDLGAWWPLILIGIGVLLVAMSVRPGRRSG